MGRIITTADRGWVRDIDSKDGKPPLRIHGHEEPAGHRLRNAGGQCPGEVGGVAGRAVRRWNDQRHGTGRNARSHGAHAGDRWVFRSSVDGHRISHRGRAGTCTACHVRGAGAICHRLRFVILAALLAEKADILIANVGINPTRTGVIDILRGMGADISLENVSRARRGAGCRYSCAVVAAARWRRSIRHWCRWPSTSFRCCLLRRPQRREDGVFRTSASCGSRKATASRAMAEGMRRLGITGRRIAGWRHRPRRPLHGRNGGQLRRSSRGDVAGGCGYGRRLARSWFGDVDAVDTSFPGFASCLASIGADIAPREDDSVMTRTGPGHRHRRPQRIRQGHDRAPRCRCAGLASARQRRAVSTGCPGGQAQAGVCPRRRRTGWREVARTLDVRFDSNEDGSASGSGWMGMTSRSRSGPRRPAPGPPAVAAIPAVREALLERQRAFQQPPGLVADGRDMGTHVFPGCAAQDLPDGER